MSITIKVTPRVANLRSLRGDEQLRQLLAGGCSLCDHNPDDCFCSANSVADRLCERKMTLIATFDGGHGRVGTITNGDSTCSVCGKESVRCVSIDGSDGEYDAGSICVDCMSEFGQSIQRNERENCAVVLEMNGYIDAAAIVRAQGTPQVGAEDELEGGA